MSLRLEIIPAGTGDTLTIEDGDIVSLNPVRTHTALGDFRITLKGDRRLEKRAQRQDRINVINEDVSGNVISRDVKFAGYITNCEQLVASGNTEISGKGIAKQLQETRPDIETLPNGTVTYDNVFVGDAIEDYWSRTPFNNVTVTKQPSNVVVQDSLTQSADTTQEWNDILSSIPNDTPLIIENGKLKQAQSGYVAEAENQDILQKTSDVSYSGGSAAQDLNNVGDVVVRWDFTTEYDLNANEWQAAVRTDKATDNGTGNVFSIFVDGQEVASSFPADLLSWDRRTADFDLAAGNHTLTVEIQQVIDDQAIIDVVSVLDTNYTYTFDNTVDVDNGYLDGPALYPTDANPVVTTDATNTTRNIVEATVGIVANDTSNEQRLGLSDDGGTTFQRGSNTASLTENFTDAGRQLVTEFRLSGITGTERNATPQFNYQGQEIDSFETKVDLDDRIVYVGKEVGQNHFKNLQTLHEDGDYIWSIDHTSDEPATMPVYSFPRGEEVRTLPNVADNEIDETPAVDGENFYNVIPLQGGLDSNGNRPFEEVKDQDSINEVGKEISPGLLRNPTISSDTEAQFIAQALLDKALKNGELRGQKTIPPTFDVLPGFAYPVGWLDDADSELTLEQISLQKAKDGAETQLDFTGDSGFARDVNELRRQAREQSDEL